MSDALVEAFGNRVSLQHRLRTGIVDARIFGDAFAWSCLIEIKNTLSIDAYDQLERYRSCIRTPVSRVIIAKNCGPVAFPEQPIYLRNIADLKALAPGFYVLPFTSKGKTK